MRRNLHTLGILWLAFAAYALGTWLIAYTFLHGMVSGHPWFLNMGAPWMHGAPMVPAGAFWWVPLVTVLVTLRAILSVFTGIALLTRQSWGRTLAIVVACVTLFKPIVGTALAIYTLWVLLGPFSGLEYAQIVSSGPEPD